MSTTPRDGGPAFPVPPEICSGPNNNWSYAYEGMTLRDYFAAAFAAAVLQGFLAGRDSYTPAAHAAKWAYEQADAMLAERSKRNGGSS
jgi:hypothetical protein